MIRCNICVPNKSGKARNSKVPRVTSFTKTYQVLSLHLLNINFFGKDLAVVLHFLSIDYVVCFYSTNFVVQAPLKHGFLARDLGLFFQLLNLKSEYENEKKIMD